mgnify:CR=1 FL=1
MTREQFVDWMADDPDAWDTLWAARWVSKTKEKKGDENEAEKDFRVIRSTDPIKFQSMLADFEERLAKIKVLRLKETASQEAGVDEGTDKALELSEQLLRDILANEKIKCPQCGCEFLEEV